MADEIIIPDDKTAAIAAAGDALNRARLQYDCIVFKTAAQLGANPDEFELKAEGNQLKFVRKANQG